MGISLYTRGLISLEPKENVLIHRLERNLKDVGLLRNYLNSYSCEPQTYTDFKWLRSLRNKLEAFTMVNKDIILSIKDRKEPIQSFLEKVQEQYPEFNALKQGVDEYMDKTKSPTTHCSG
ncbi:MAG: hypothetical protein CR994_02525 [Maribacter sp.]|nr:MAG: hypothetical protein CR994_02525 [Maribacter sp.]